MKNLAKLAIAFMLMFLWAGCLPNAALAEGTPNLTVTGVTSEGNITIMPEYRAYSITEPGSYTISGTTTREFIRIDAPSGEFEITLDGVSITDPGYSAAFEIQQDSKANVTINLKGDNRLEGGNNHAGLEKNHYPNKTAPVDVGTLTIQAAGEGARLTAVGGSDAAGIGGPNAGNTGNIVIKSGHIIAKGNKGGAGIGGGNQNSNGGSAINIRIEGGTVEATCEREAAAIGGGSNGYVDGIFISGGYVKATGTGHGAVGIGVGYSSYGCKNIDISGGTVIATGTKSDDGNAPGIGYGPNLISSRNDSTKITGGVVITDGGVEDHYNKLNHSGGFYLPQVPDAEGNIEGFVKGSATLAKDLTIPSGARVTIAEGATLKITEGAALTVAEGATLNIGEGATLNNDAGVLEIDEGATFNNNGTLTQDRAPHFLDGNNPPIQYTVTFDVKGHGTAPAAQTVSAEDKAVKPADPSEAGWTFVGWYTDENYTTAYDFNRAVTADLTLYAKWKAKTSNSGSNSSATADTHVGFDSNGGTAINGQLVIKGAKITKPEDPVREGYRFLGWYVGDELFDFNQKVNKGITLRAKWEAIEKDPEKNEPDIALSSFNIRLVIGSNVLIEKKDGVDHSVMMDIVPYIEQGRTMTPIRFIAEAMGFKVDWDEAKRTVILTDGANRVEIPVDTNQFITNGKVYVSDVAPVIKEGRTFMAIANFARALGLENEKNIIWDPETQTVTFIR